MKPKFLNFFYSLFIILFLFYFLPTTVKAAAPTLTNFQSSSWADGGASEVTPTLIWNSGDVVVCVGGTRDKVYTLNTPTATGLTFSAIKFANGNSLAYAWSATAASSGSSAVSANTDGVFTNRGLSCFVFSGSSGIGNSATIINLGTSVIPLSRVSDNSAVITVMTDFNAVNDTVVDPSPAGGTQRVAANVSNVYSGFVFNWGDQGAAGTSSYGVTNYSGSPNMTGIVLEVKGITGGTPTPTPTPTPTTTPTPTPDATSPTVPTNLSATAISSSAISLSWTISSDNVGVSGYKVFRGGVQIGTNVTNSYSDTNLTASTSYSYTISAYDAAGNNSAQSTSASATTLAVSGGQTVTANSCSLVDVQAAVAAVSRGGMVNVPAGNCTWSSGLSLTKGITLTGAGVGNTKITSSGGSVLISANPDATAITNSENIKITDFTFDGANTTCNLLALSGASGVSGTKPYKYYIIGNNKFQNGCTSGEGIITASGANGDGQLRGVIYNNIFDRCNIIIRIFSNNDTREWSNTAFNNLSYGSQDSLYFENNTIMFSSSFSGDNPGWIESGQGGRFVGRFNTWNLANATSPQEVWDIHGFQNWSGTVNSGQTGTMIVEYYGNTLTNMGTYRWINHRGSWGLFFNNTLTGSGGNGIDMNQYAGCPSQISPAPSNYNPVVNNSYVFNNTKNGVNVSMQGTSIACGVAENANWWNYTPSFNGSVGVGMGALSSRPATCTTGVGYWATDQGNWNSSGSGGQGVFYKCTSTNNWTLYYSPYSYPNPLRGVSTPPPTPVPGDLNLDHIINSLDFSLLNTKWLQSFPTYDLLVDSIINSFDYAILKSNWGKTW